MYHLGKHSLSISVCFSRNSRVAKKNSIHTGRSGGEADEGNLTNG